MTQEAKKMMDSSTIFGENSEFERIAAVLGGAKVDSRDAKRSTPTLWSDLPALDHIAQLILEIDSHAAAQNESDEVKIRNHNRSLLAAQLGCTAEDIEAIVESYGDSWQQYVLDARIRQGMSSTHMRDVTWDRLEAATLKKLVILVENPVAKLSVAELLAVAKTANTANRGDRAIKGPGQGVGGGPVPQNHVQTNIFLGGDPANGVLPAGNLGTISLSLSQRVLKQLSTPKEIEGESERTLDSMEMMGIKDIQKIGEGIDKETDDDSKR